MLSAPSLRTRLGTWAAGLAAVGLVAGGVVVAAPAAGAPLALKVTLSATYTDAGGTTAATTGAVSGETTAADDGAVVAAGAAGFQYTATCTLPDGVTACTAGGAKVRTTWVMRADGVGETAVPDAAGLTSRRGWATTGVHPVSVIVDYESDSATGTGTAAITTYASDRYADITVATPNASAVWAATAAGLITGCRPDTDPGSGAGQMDFCPSPSAADQPVAAKPPAAQLTVLRNAVTGELCLASDAACNVTADAQAWNQNGNPTGPCDARDSQCYLKLQETNPGLVNTAAGGIFYQPTLCADNVTEPVTANTTGSVTAVGVQGFNLVRGTEPGCATYRDLLGGLVAAAGSFTAPPANTPAVPVNTAVRNTITNPTFASGTGWTLTGGATLAAGTSDGSPLSGGTVTLPAGASASTQTRYQVTAGAPATLVAVARSEGATVTVTVNYYTSVSASSPIGTLTRTFLVANNPAVGAASTGTTLVVPSVVPYSATHATATVTATAGQATLLNVTAATKPSVSGDKLTGIGTPGFPVGSGSGGMLVACGAGPQPDDTVRRAVGLFGSTVTWCDTDRALTRRAAYTLVGTAAGWTPRDSAEALAFRDLKNPTLGSTTTSAEATLRGWVGAALDNGVGPVGSTACPNGQTGQCFLPDDAMTRTELAALLAAAATGPGSSFAYTPGASPDGTTVGPAFGFAAVTGPARALAGLSGAGR